MSAHYNVFAGQSLERLAALSDGVFAIAMTLLVLDLRVPAATLIHGEQDLLRALVQVTPNLLAFLMSFLALGIIWVGQQTQLSSFQRGDRNFAWMHLAMLLTVSLFPFSTALLARFITYRTALLIYWLNIFLLGAGLFASRRYAANALPMRAGVTPEMMSAAERRILIAQGLYAFGALLCVFSTYLSIGFMVLVQLNYAVAPRLPLLHRL